MATAPSPSSFTQLLAKRVRAHLVDIGNHHSHPSLMQGSDDFTTNVPSATRHDGRPVLVVEGVSHKRTPLVHHHVIEKETRAIGRTVIRAEKPFDHDLLIKHHLRKIRFKGRPAGGLGPEDLVVRAYHIP